MKVFRFSGEGVFFLFCLFLFCIFGLPSVSQSFCENDFSSVICVALKVDTRNLRTEYSVAAY